LSPDLISRTARAFDASEASSDLLYSKGTAATTRWRSYDHKDNFEPAQAATAPPSDADTFGSWLKYDGSLPVSADQAKLLNDDERPTSWFKYETKPVASLLEPIEAVRTKTRIPLPETAAHIPATQAPVADAPEPKCLPDPDLPEPTEIAPETLASAEPAAADAAIAELEPQTESHDAEPSTLPEEPATARDAHPGTRSVPRVDIWSEEPAIAEEAPISAETADALTAVEPAREADPQPEATAIEPAVIVEQLANADEVPTPLEDAIADTAVARLEPDPQAEPAAPEFRNVIEEPAIAAVAPTSIDAAVADLPPVPDFPLEAVAIERTVVVEETAISGDAAASIEAPLATVESPAEDPAAAVDDTAAAETEPGPAVLKIASTDRAAAAPEEAPSEPLTQEPADAPEPRDVEPTLLPTDALLSFTPESEQPAAAVTQFKALPVATDWAPIGEVSIPAEVPEPTPSAPVLAAEVDAPSSIPTMPAPVSEAAPIEESRPPIAVVEPAITPAAPGKKAMLARLAAMLEQALSAKRSTPSSAPVDAPQSPEPAEAIEPEPLVEGGPSVADDAPAAETEVAEIAEPAAEEPALTAEQLPAATPEEMPAEIASSPEEFGEPDAHEPSADISAEWPIESEALPQVEADAAPHPIDALQAEPEALLAPVSALEASAAEFDVPAEQAALEQEPTLLDTAVAKTPDPAKKALLSRLAGMLERAITRRPVSAAAELLADPPLEISAPPVVDEIPSPAIELPDAGSAEIQAEPLEITTAVEVAPAELAMPIAEAAEDDAAMPEVAADPEVRIASPASEFLVVDEAIPAATQAPAKLADVSVDALKATAAITSAESNDLPPVAVAEATEAPAPVEVAPEPKVIAASPRDEAVVLETGTPLQSETTGAETLLPPLAEELAAAVHEAPEGDATPAIEAFDTSPAWIPESPIVATFDALESPSSRASNDSETVAPPVEPTTGAALPAMPVAEDEIATGSRAPSVVDAGLTEEASANAAAIEPAAEAAQARRPQASDAEPVSEFLPDVIPAAIEPPDQVLEVSDPVVAPTVAGSELADEAPKPLVAATEGADEPPAGATAILAVGDNENPASSAAPLPVAADPLPTPAQQEKAARQALTDDLAEMIHNVLSTTQFATKALKPKRYDEVPQPVDQPELSELAEELSASLPHPVVIQSRFSRTERVLGFASIGMMIAVGCFGFSLWRDRGVVPAQAPAVAVAAPPSNNWGERARDMTRDFGALATVTEVPKTPSVGPEAGPPKPIGGPHGPELAQ
jgi:hypothetical protein